MDTSIGSEELASQRQRTPGSDTSLDGLDGRPRPGRVLVVHNAYQQPGGEDQVFAAETALLEEHGHHVTRYAVHNDEIEGMVRAKLAGLTAWNPHSYRTLRRLIRREKPEVAHFHNTFPLVSPAAYHAARAEGVPVVQTLHNYRLLCPNAQLYRDGHACEDCVGKTVPWPGMAHSCYRGSRAASATVAAMLVAHRALGTWRETVSAYVALTDFARQKFVEGGLPAEKVLVKPNFVHPDPGTGEGRGGYLLFVGRLSQEKGIETLLAARERLKGKVPLKVVGDGPLAGKVAASGVEWLGRQPKDRVLALMKDALGLVFPSVWYEGFPLVIAEAYAVGLPVIAGNLGGMSSLIDHRRTGLHFRPGDPENLATEVRWALDHPAELRKMRGEARNEFLTKYTAERNYRSLVGVYESVIGRTEEVRR